MDLSLLGFKKPGARGTHPSSQELRDALRDNADRLETVLLGLAPGVQEGVLGVNDGLASMLNPTTMRVPAGMAWIDGDGVGGLNGRYRVTWPQTDLPIPLATGANFRGHRITVPVPATGHGASAPVVRSGVDNATVTIDTLDTNLAAGGAPALAAGEFQVSAVITNSSAIVGTRSRRSMANGLRRMTSRTSAIAAPTSTTYAGRTSVAGGVLDFRAESVGALLQISLSAHISGSGLWLVLESVSGGVTTKIREFEATPGDHTFSAVVTPGLGSNLFQWKQFGPATAKIDAYDSSASAGGGAVLMSGIEHVGLYDSVVV